MSVDPTPRPPTEEERTAQHEFRVRFEEAGPDGRIRTSTLLRYAAELAWQHSELRGFGRAWYRERGLAWLVRGIDLRLLRPVSDGDTLVGMTAVVASRKVIARRRTEFRATSGELAAVAVVDWAMTSIAGTPTRVPEVIGIAFGMPADSTFAPIRARPTPPLADGMDGDGPDTGTGRRTTLDLIVRRQELDPIGHVNNAVYLDWAEEAIATAAGPGDDSVFEAFPRRWRLEYLGAAGPGDVARATAWRDDDGWSCLITDARNGGRFVGAALRLGAEGTATDVEPG